MLLFSNENCVLTCDEGNDGNILIKKLPFLKFYSCAKFELEIACKEAAMSF